MKQNNVTDLFDGRNRQKRKSFLRKYFMEAKMKNLFLLVIMLIFSFTGCTEPDGGNTNTDEQIPEIYRDFYNYKLGRQDSSGLLEVENPTNRERLVFHTDFSPDTYIGTVGPLSSIKVRLPNEEFYSIITVDKKDYEERLFQASQFSNLTYHSRTQPYNVKINAGLTTGNRQWILNNYTKYWVKIVDVSNPSIVYAVLAPGTLRVTLPLSVGSYYNYEPIFLSEVRYQGNVLALSEFSHRSSGGTTNVDANPIYSSNFPVTLTFNDLKPNVLVINNSGRTLRIFKTKSTQISNGAVGADFSIGSGSRALVTGFDVGDNVSDIYFWAVGWTDGGNDGFRQVHQSESMKENKVYQITVSADGNTTSLQVLEASEVYD